MAVADTLKIFDTLRKSFDEQQAKTIALAIEIAAEENNKTLSEKLATLATKEELKLEIAALKAEMHDLHAKSVRWMFVFIFGQFWAIVGVLFAFFRK